MWGPVRMPITSALPLKKPEESIQPCIRLRAAGQIYGMGRNSAFLYISEFMESVNARARTYIVTRTRAREHTQADTRASGSSS